MEKLHDWYELKKKVAKMEDKEKKVKEFNIRKRADIKKNEMAVDLDKGLNTTHFTSIASGVLNPKNMMGDALIKKLKMQAVKMGKTGVSFDVEKAHANKRREEDRNKAR